MDTLREATYQILLDASSSIGAEVPTEVVYQELADLMAGRLAMPCVWVGWLPSNREWVQVLAASGPAAAYARELRPSTTSAFFETKLPGTGETRPGGLVYFQEFSDPRLAEWKEKAQEFGLDGSAHTIFYGPSGGRGALTLYRGPEGPFPKELGPLLDGLRSDLEQFLERREIYDHLISLNHSQKVSLAAHQQLLRMQGPQEMFERLVEIVVEQTGVIGAYVAVPQEGSEWLNVSAAAAKNEALRQALLCLTPSRDPDNFPYGQMVSSQTFQRQAPFISNTVHSELALQAVLDRDPALENIHSCMGWPLLVTEDTGPSAVLVIEAEDTQHFTEALQQLLLHLTESLSLALGQLRLRESEKRLQQYQEAAIEAQQALLHLQDPQEMLRHLTKIIVEKTDAVACHVVMPSEDTDKLKVVAASARDHAVQEALLQLRFPKTPPDFAAEGTVASRSFQKNAPVGPVSTEVPWLRSFLEREPALWAIRSMMGWPILLEGEDAPYAVLVIDAADEGYFTGALQQLLRQLTSSFSVAMERRKNEKSLRKLSLAVEQNPSSIVITDLNGSIEYVNDAFVKVTGYSRSEVLGKNPRILQSGKTPKETYVKMWELLLSGEIWKGEFINRTKDGREYIEQALISPVRQAGGNITHYLSIKEDITERRRNEGALRESEERWKFALEGSEAVVFDWDIQNDVVTYSEQWEKILGVSTQELGSSSLGFYEHVHPDDASLFMDTMRACLRGKNRSFSIEVRMQCQDGHWKWVLGRGMVVRRDAANRALRMIGTITDISLRKVTEEEIRRLAFHDSLTGLPNRLALEGHLDKAMARALRHKKQLAVCLLDLDDFKPVNDNYGHEAGDQLLKTLAARLQTITRTSDFIARLGGDEFVLLVEDLESEDDLSLVMDNLQQTVAMPFVLSGQVTVEIQASMGVCLYDPSRTGKEETGDLLLRYADLALYQIKSQKNDRRRSWSLYNESPCMMENIFP